MRDTMRIQPFMNELGKIWAASAPDMRFGQFMCNVMGEMANKHGDPFFWEEKEFMTYLKEIPWIKTN